MERQLKRYFREVRNKPGITGDLLMQKLEMRLDNVVYRAGFARSRLTSRQLVKHNYFEINGKKTNIPSHEVKAGDVISLRDSKTGKKYINQLRETFQGKKTADVSLEWIEVDPEKLTIKIKNKPARSDIGIGIDAQSIVEFYSR